MARKQGLIFRWLQRGRAPAAYSISHGDFFQFANVDEKGNFGPPFMVLKFLRRAKGCWPWRKYIWDVEATFILNVANPPDWISHLCSTIEKKGEE